MREGRDDIFQRNANAAETALGESRSSSSTDNDRRMGHITQTVLWMSVLPSTINGTDLGVQEWIDS